MVTLLIPFVVSAKSTPVPVRESVWGEFPVLSVTVSDPERRPLEVGTKAICNEQAESAATLMPQVLLTGRTTKSPVTAMPCTESGTLTLLVRVTVCEAD
jgi:hypothetical protein